jgi:hypothetical protein
MFADIQHLDLVTIPIARSTSTVWQVIAESIEKGEKIVLVEQWPQLPEETHLLRVKPVNMRPATPQQQARALAAVGALTPAMVLHLQRRAHQLNEWLADEVSIRQIIRQENGEGEATTPELVQEGPESIPDR